MGFRGTGEARGKIRKGYETRESLREGEEECGGEGPRTTEEEEEEGGREGGRQGI